MIETVTPDVCGSRRRKRVALIAFGAGAVAAAALLGALLGLAGAALGARDGLLAVAVLAALAAARELGLVRLPLPQARLQVPERWRFELPLPVWAAGYGAGLGIGVMTYQPVATFWVACAAAVALARPLPAAACFALYGVGRALMVALPGRRGAEPAEAAERLALRRPALVRANGLALALCAVALAAAPAAGAGPSQPLDLGAGSQLDPAPSRGVLAYTQRDGDVSTVAVRVSPTDVRLFPGRSPALEGEQVAFEDDAGVRVVRWRNRAEVTRVPGASRPALAWPWLAYRLVRLDGGGTELWLRNLASGKSRLVTRAGPRLDLGRPALEGGRVVWHVAGQGGSRIGFYRIANGARRVLATSKIGLLAYPSLSGPRLVFVDQRAGSSYLRLRRLDQTRVVTIARTHTRVEAFWTTGLAGRNAYVTRWFAGDGYAQIERLRF